jgi:hypothetical protein
MAFCFVVENSPPRNDNRDLNSFRSSSKTCSSFSSWSIITARLMYVGTRKKRRLAKMRRRKRTRLGDNFDKAIRGTRCRGCHLGIFLSLKVYDTFILVVCIERIYSALCLDSLLEENLLCWQVYTLMDRQGGLPHRYLNFTLFKGYDIQMKLGLIKILIFFVVLSLRQMVSFFFVRRYGQG